MKRTFLSLASIAGVAAFVPAPGYSAPAPIAAPAPVAAAPEPAPAPEPVMAPAPTTASNAPYAPITDVLLQSNPASQGSVSSILTIPHRWAEKRVAMFQWSGDTSNKSSVLAYGTMDNIFAGFQANKDRGDFTAGYTTPQWAAGLKVNFGKSWRTTSDSVNGRWQPNKESDATYAADGLELIGSYNMDPYHLSGSLFWRTIETSESWQTAAPTAGDRNTYSNRFDSIGVKLGLRTYVTGKEGFAWRVSLTAAERYLRPSGSERNYQGVRIAVMDDSSYEKTEVYDLGLTGDIGYRFATAGNSQFTAGLNSVFNTTNGKPDSINVTISNHDKYDYYWTLSTTPNVGLLLPLTERWTLLGGAGLKFAYTSYDIVRGEDEVKISTLTTTAPAGNFGFRYAKDIWAVEAQVSSDLLTNGPYFITGRDGSSTDADGHYVAGGPALAQFALTVNLK